MNYKKLQIVPIKRRYLRISETENPIPLIVFQCEKFIPFVFMDLRILVNSSNLVGKKGSVEILTNFFSMLLGATARNASTAVGPHMAITPEKVIQHHRKAQGRFGGTGTVPSDNR